MDEQQPKQEQATTPAAPTTGGIKVLLVEDDRFLRELIAQKLEREGFDVMQAVDGEEALRKVGERKPEIILLDLILPGIGGFDVLKKVKEGPDTSGIPVVILSNLGQREDVEKGLGLGATDFLIKAHFTPGEIITKIKAILNEGHK